MTRTALERRFPGLDARRVAMNGPWDGGRLENAADGVRRAEILAAWLRSRELCEEATACGCSVVVLVSHADLLALILSNLLGDTAAAHRAAATTCGGGSPASDGAPGLREGRTLQAAAACEEEALADYLRSVRAKYPISLASACLVEVGNDGAVTVRATSSKSILAGRWRCCLQ
jgi:hypothetical protein